MNDAHDSRKDDGGPAFPCSKCGDTVIFMAEWQRRDKRCLPCKRKQQNAKNLEKGDLLKTEAKAAYARRKGYYKQYWLDARKDDLHLKKRAARRKVSTEIEAGRLVRGKCKTCGKTNADAHHEDYDKPLDVQWFCRRCHFAEERKITCQ